MNNSTGRIRVDKIDFDKPILNKNGQPLRILSISMHCCIRVVKKLRALRKIGYSVDGLANRVSYGTTDFDTLAIFQNEKQFKRYLINNKDRWDVLEFNNEPDKPVQWIKETLPSIPLTVDLHDLDSIRRQVIPLDEREVFNLADGLTFVSEPIRKSTCKLHRVTVPTINLLSYCNDGIIEYDEGQISSRKSLI